MRIIFAGTPEFARVALTALHAAGHTVVAVLTQPDRPSGRGMKLTPSAVKQEAIRLGLPVLQPESLKSVESQDVLRALTADVMVVAAYGLILPQAVLDMPRYGCLNIHASLLPRWRGAAPIHRAIQAGDSETGITIMQMDAGLDTGAMLMRQAIPIDADDTTGSLHDKLALLGAEMAVAALDAVDAGTLIAESQPVAGVTYAAKIGKAEALLDFTLDAQQLVRNIRAFNPAPGAFFLWQAQPVKIWRAQVQAGAGRPGTVLVADNDGIVVACGRDALRITELQMAGGKRQPAGQWLAGHPLSAGLNFCENAPSI
ncbi:MAG: methionyl-tRNA formyltransferase [Sulfuriferula sp.]|nr:methionyl-tRNA formyltransferase [Sulfuriferula sp.]